MIIMQNCTWVLPIRLWESGGTGISQAWVEKLFLIINIQQFTEFIRGKLLLLPGTWNYVDHRNSVFIQCTMIIKLFRKEERIESKPSVQKKVWLLTTSLRICNPDIKQFTWSQRNPLIRCLDFWLTSTEIQDDVAIKIIQAVKSDHLVITLMLNSLDKQPFGTSYRKFNSSLLDNPSYYVYLITTR